MTAELGDVRLVMHHADSAKLLRAALANSLHFHQVMVVQATSTFRFELERKQPREALRHERRAAEFARRLDLVQQLLDQLPTDSQALDAPMGET